MKILIFGAEGIAGSAILRGIPGAVGTTRRAETNDTRILPNVDVTRRDDIDRAFSWAEPEVAINCVGIVKSECDKHVPERVFDVNAVAPHMIAALAGTTKCRVVHLSTDCVFDGTRGARTEADRSDATDLYGQAKADGELTDYAHCVTLRTSFIGRDPIYGRGLLEWLLAQTNEAVGYTRAVWSGLSAPELARVAELVLSTPELAGLYHVAGPLISKADLLETLIAAYGLPCRVRRVDEPHIDRSLDGSLFARAAGYAAPTWTDMAKELAWRSS